MPNRILRDWTDSETIEMLDVHAERFFVRLIMKVDDFGRYTANSKMLKSTLFPLKSDIRETDISRWLAACNNSGLISLYNIASKEFLEIKNFKQRLRQSVEKYPAPDVCQSSDSQVTVIRPLEKKPNPETETKQKAASLEFISNKDFIPVIEKWLEYKKSRIETYKSEDSIKAFCKKLSDLSANDIPVAEKIIEQSMANNWAGIFELKNNLNNVRSKTNTGHAPDPARSNREYEPL